ncbi:hypothetical protein BKA67DRAFT_545735 [Truncatella angustata]|uniref:NADPH:adrenodoxin oxidoreductase, mitochondrial n=1 Tax=Truncatella angustata TaxID=152316 RepID=A0A9P8UV52_9PEZI|nr:uncharacterized protein BKA67DRAFT_545735 [Truncatella angustata]KAH6659769.1 hypothetical protein BKA67DRAFT_545735 [Truncatella angustata]KAH8203107.1 hypothetical protein TruAng_002740 [Truncatella angustata]
MAAVARSWICRSCQGKALSSPPLVTPRSRNFYSTTPSSRQDKPFRMAVVGSGPAGFYTAYRVMSKIQRAKVDMFEALPVPFGLVRFGVAPDHPEVKNCQDKFEEVAASPDFTFIGNVSVGNQGGHFDGCTVPLDALMRHYDAVVFAYGASKDKKLGVPGEDLKGIYSAREFVGWYNGLPEYADLNPDLTRGDEAVIIGQGNVALDVARMLLENVDVLRKSDITEAAIETLLRSRVKRVHVVGRRGPMQAAYTIKEVRELMKLHDVGFHRIDMGLVPDEISKLPRAQKRLMEVIVKGSTAKEDVAKTWSLDFCLSPAEFRGDPLAGLQSTLFERTLLSAPFDPTSKVRGTGEKLEVPSALAFRSIGYKSVALPGFTEAGILFDDRSGVIRNDGLGRVFTRGAVDASAPTHLGGVYCAGWVKRGPTGVIASTMQDAFSTGDAIAADWSSEASFLGNGGSHGWDSLRHEVDTSKSTVITWQDWHKIDKAEKERGSKIGKQREKYTRISDMLSAAS